MIETAGTRTAVGKNRFESQGEWRPACLGRSTGHPGSERATGNRSLADEIGGRRAGTHSRRAGIRVGAGGAEQNIPLVDIGLERHGTRRGAADLVGENTRGGGRSETRIRQLHDHGAGHRGEIDAAELNVGFRGSSIKRFGSKNTAGLVFFAVKNNLID